MSEIGGRYSGRQILIPVIVAGLGNDQLTMVEANALLDTGATSSAITAKIAASLGLLARGRRVMGTAGGTRRTNIFGFSLAFSPFCVVMQQGQIGSAPLFLPHEIAGIEFTEGIDFQVLIGMDVISTGELKISSDRSWSFKF